ncbi:hypothetical protein GOV14_01450 [Candidatus Pacearchaeota archaeon]|nr:hypothetical protein [Candidatus Pacearchaeota archaeon]
MKGIESKIRKDIAQRIIEKQELPLNSNTQYNGKLNLETYLKYVPTESLESSCLAYLALKKISPKIANIAGTLYELKHSEDSEKFEIYERLMVLELEKQFAAEQGNYNKAAALRDQIVEMREELKW